MMPKFVFLIKNNTVNHFSIKKKTAQTITLPIIYKFRRYWSSSESKIAIDFEVRIYKYIVHPISLSRSIVANKQYHLVVTEGGSIHQKNRVVTFFILQVVTL